MMKNADWGIVALTMLDSYGFLFHMLHIDFSTHALIHFAALEHFLQSDKIYGNRVVRFFSTIAALGTDPNP